MFEDIYYSSNEDEDISGEDEFKHVFFKHNGLPERWCERNQFTIAELGLGSGLNCLLTIREWLKHCEICDENKVLHYIAIEKYPLTPEVVMALLSRYPGLQPLCDEFIENYPPAVATTHIRYLFNHRVIIHFKFLDAYDALKDENLKVDAWYLDGFSPAKNETMWSANLFEALVKNSRNRATFSTYTAAGFVKRNLQGAGFEVSKVSGFGKKRDMLKGVLSSTQKKPLTYIDRPWFNLPVSTVTAKHLCVLGAGIAGLSVAYAMIRRGWTVTIVDKHPHVAGETSGNPAAIVYPRLSVNNAVDMKFYTSAYCHSVYMLAELQKTSSQQFWFDTGLVQQIERKKLLSIIENNNFNGEYVSVFENDATDDESDVFAKFHSAGVVLPSVLCDVLKNECGKRLTMFHADIDNVTNRKNKWQCYSGEELINESDYFVIANGEGIGGIGLLPEFSVERVRGQMAVLNANTKSKKINMTINSNVHITPAILNKHYVGATYTRGNESVAVNENETSDLMESIDSLLPDTFVSEDCVASWVGFRLSSKDRVPIVGALPDEKFFKQEYVDICHGKVNKTYEMAKHLDGLYISAAHGSRGFTTAFISAEIIAAQLNDEPMPVDKSVLDYLSPARFIVNNLKRG